MSSSSNSGRRGTSKSGFRDTDTLTDREGRLASVLDQAAQSASSAEYALTLTGAISVELPRTAPELIWRLLLMQTREQAHSLNRSIGLLKAAREDVVGLRP
jgi:hypothetical protein